MSQWFVIPDIAAFTDKARAIVFNNFGLWNQEAEYSLILDDVSAKEQEDFNKVLTHGESLTIVKSIVKKEKSKKSKKIRYILNDDLFAKIVNDLNARMVSNIINNLVQKGVVESAFDSEKNDFIFWVKDDEEEKPETD